MKIIGHRGARALAPENTLAAIQAGLTAGAEIIEIDVRTTLDGMTILSHDVSMEAADGQKLAVHSTNYSELLQAVPNLCTLQQALAATDRQAILMVEVKRGCDVEPVVQVLAACLRSGRQPQTLWIGSKGSRLLRDLHTALPDIPCIVIEPWSGVRATWRARRLGTDMLAMNQLFFWSFFVRSISKRYKLYGYTVDDPKRAERLQRQGIAGIITDDPNIATPDTYRRPSHL